MEMDFEKGAFLIMLEEAVMPVNNHLRGIFGVPHISAYHNRKQNK